MKTGGLDMKKKISVILSMLVLCCLLITAAVPASAISYKNKIKLRSEAALVVDKQTGQEIFSVNADKKMYPASTTKIMTYTVVADWLGKTLNGKKITLKTEIPIKQEVLSILDGTGSSIANVQAHVGEKMTVLDLLYSMMVPSGNDAAVVLADYFGSGSIPKFVEMMNNKAKELGCKNTHFANPDGLHDPDHYTTAIDLMKMTQNALTLPEFAKITNTDTYYVMDDDYPLVTTNYMIDVNRGGDYYYQYAQGIKTGTTDEAGHCLVTMGVADGNSFIAVLLNSPIKDPDEYGTMYDAADLFRWALTSFETGRVLSAETPICEVHVNEAMENSDLMLVPEKNVNAVVPKDFKKSDIEVVPDIPSSIEAPVEKGDIVGKAKIYYKGKQVDKKQQIGEVNLVASDSVERSGFLHAGSVFKDITSQMWFIIIIAGIILLLVLYIVISTIISRRNKKRKRSVRRYRNF